MPRKHGYFWLLANGLQNSIMRAHGRTTGVITPTLNFLTLSASSIQEDAVAGSIVGTIQNTTPGSVLSLDDNAGGLFAIVSGNIETAGALDYETATSHTIQIREVLAGYTDRVTPIAISVTDVAELVAPTISNAAITGTPTDGSTLTATATISGNPTPTVTYQWQKNGVDIAGQAGATIALDEAAMSLLDTDTISCEIDATNSQGSANAEPTIAYQAAPAPGAADYFKQRHEGDSITAITGSSTDFFVDRHPQWDMQNVGQSGSRITLHVPDRVAGIVAEAPGIITVALGANDLATYAGATPQEGADAWWVAYQDLIAQYRAIPDVRILVATVLPVDEPQAGQAYVDNQFNVRAAYINGVIRASVGTVIDGVIDYEQNAILADPATWADPTYSGDGLHPSGALYDLMKPIFSAAVYDMMVQATGLDILPPVLEQKSADGAALNVTIYYNDTIHPGFYHQLRLASDANMSEYHGAALRETPRIIIEETDFGAVSLPPDFVALLNDQTNGLNRAQLTVSRDPDPEVHFIDSNIVEDVVNLLAPSTFDSSNTRTARVILSNGDLDAESANINAKAVYCAPSTNSRTGKRFVSFEVLATDGVEAILAGLVIPSHNFASPGTLTNNSSILLYLNSSNDTRGSLGSLSYGGPKWLVGDKPHVAWDTDAGLAWVGLNGVWFNGDPAAGTGGGPLPATGGLKPFVGLYVDQVAQGTQKIGMRPSDNTHKPTGFLGLDE